jgi:OHCU decarboxylase
MKSDPAEFEFAAPASLHGALQLLARQPSAWLPIAGGTDVMVQYAAGTLTARKLLSIWNLPELRRIGTLPDEVQIGAGSTYTDLREHEVLAREFPLLVRAASWTGGIANQNRGTIGGNIVNASPAADSLPALLVYDAELVLASVRGERRIAYRKFHKGYKQTDLAAGELVRSVCLPRKFSTYLAYARKIGTRNAQAISKVCIAALGRVEKKVISGRVDVVLDDVRIALGSVAPTPIRLGQTERVLNGKSLDDSLLALAQQTAAAEIKPISDIRSTARYRAAVVRNLIGEFLTTLREAGTSQSGALARWNHLPVSEAQNEILACCGSMAWAREMACRRPMGNEAELLSVASEVWKSLTGPDWEQAFKSHPRIGESQAGQPPRAANAAQRTSAWSAKEQIGVSTAADALKVALAEANLEYEKRFRRTFIVCATGKSASEILAIIRQRLENDDETEFREAAEQQRQITQIRLKKWLTE